MRKLERHWNNILQNPETLTVELQNSPHVESKDELYQQRKSIGPGGSRGLQIIWKRNDIPQFCKRLFYCDLLDIKALRSMLQNSRLTSARVAHRKEPG